jgi:hypothetical protein
VTYLGNCWLCGGVDGVCAGEGFEGSELLERADNLLWFGQDRDWVRLETGAGSVAGFKLAVEDKGGEGEFLGRQAPRRR